MYRTNGFPVDGAVFTFKHADNIIWTAAVSSQCHDMSVACPSGVRPWYERW
jgi:hypothetical protein